MALKRRTSSWLLTVVVVIALTGCEPGPPVSPPTATPTERSPSPPSPTPTETEDESDLSTEDVVFVYSANGDVYGETVDGERVVLADGPEPEVWPSLSADGSELLYQLGSGPPGEVVHIDLVTNTTTSIGPGQFPSFGPDGRAAWVVNNATDGPKVIVGPLFSEPEAKIVAISDWDGPIQVSPPLAWDLNGTYLYYAAGWEETSDLYQTDSRGDVDPFPLGQAIGTQPAPHFLGPDVRDRSSVHVFRACCMEGIEDPWESFELGRVQFTEGGPVFQRTIALDTQDLGQTFPGWYPQVVSLGNLWRERSTGRWIESKEATWIVANQIEAWLLSEGGGKQDLGDLLIQKYGYRTKHSGGIPGTFEGWSAGPATQEGR